MSVAHGQSSASTPAAPSVHPVLVELFTSEGCSSCPPADAILAKIDGQRTGTGQLIIGLSEHVTYWNHDGWIDPFSAQAYTDRQSGYGGRFHLDSVYTPQVVVNGRQQVVGSDRPAILRAVQETGGPSSFSVHIVDAHIAGKELVITYSTSGTPPAHGASIYAVVADDTDSTQVGAGENSGHTLTHVSVARAIFKAGAVKGTEQETIHLPLTNVQPSAGGQHLVLFAQAGNFGEVFAVDTAPLKTAPE